MCRIGQMTTHLGDHNDRTLAVLLADVGRPRTWPVRGGRGGRNRDLSHTPSVAQIDAAQSLVWQRWRSLP